MVFAAIAPGYVFYKMFDEKGVDLTKRNQPAPGSFDDTFGGTEQDAIDRGGIFDQEDLDKSEKSGPNIDRIGSVLKFN